MVDVATLSYTIDSDAVRLAAKDLDRMNAAAVKADASASSLQRQLNSLTGVNRQVASTTRQSAQAFEMFDQAKQSIDQLRMSYDPLFASSKRYEAAVDTLNNALRLGVMTQGQYDTALEQVGQSYLTAAGQAKVYGSAMRASTAHTTNLMFQFQDIGMMLASGQSPLMLALQQGTQVAGIFQQLRDSGQSLSGALVGALRNVTNPMSLITIGAIAAGAALVQWGISAIGAADDGEELRKTLDDLLDAVENIKSSSEVFTLSGLDALRKKYGEIDLQVINLLNNTKTYNDLIASEALKEAMAGIMEFSGTRWFDIGISDFESSILKLRTEFKLTKNDAKVLLAAFDELAKAKTFEEQFVALDKLSGYLLVLAQGTGAGGDAARELLGIVLEAQDATKQLSAAAPGREWMASAIAGVGDLIVALDAVGNAIPEGVSGKIRPKMRPMDLGVPLPGRGGGGGGGVNERDRKLESFLESLQTERETLEAWRVEQTELLAMFNDQELATIGGHNEARLRLEQEYQERLAGLRTGYHGDAIDQAGAFAGAMAGALASGNDKMIKAAQVFAGIEAMINAYRAYNQVLADPTLPWFAKIPAAIGILAAGMRTVQAIKGLSGSSSGGTASSAAPSGVSGSTQQSEPSRVVRITFDGPEWARSIIEPIMEQIYEQTADGTKVIFAR